MIRNFVLGALALAGVFAFSSPGRAEVVVRAPFVCVRVGPGVHVRAPFVDLHVPAYPCGLPVMPVLNVGPQTQPPPPQPAGQPVLPPPTLVPGAGVPRGPMPGVVRAMSLREFADNFRPAAGSYEAVLVNPVTCQPCVVHFCLPGCPRRVSVHRCDIVYHYGIGRWVRISFDGNGYVVTSRKV